MGLFSFFTKEIAVDLGTANTLIVYNDEIVVDEPSIIAIDRDTHRLQAVGEEALRMEGRTPENIRVIRPLKDGYPCGMPAGDAPPHRPDLRG